MKNLYLFLALPFFTIRGYSQKQDKPVQYPWMMIQILYTSDSTGVGNLIYTEKTSGVAFVNEDASVQKELPLPGNVIDIAKWKGNIIAFYVDAWHDELIKDIHAVLIDGHKKTVISDKLIYSNPGNTQLSCSVSNDDRGDLGYFLVRITPRKASAGRIFANPHYLETAKTTALTAISFSEPFQPVAKPLSSAAIGAPAYFANYANRKREICILSYNDGQVTAEKFSADGQLQKKLTAPLDYSPDHLDEDGCIKGRFDPHHDDVLTFSVANPNTSSKHRNLSTFVFDFAAGKAITVESARLDKDYFSQFKDDPDFEKAKHFKNMEYLKPDGILYLGDTLVICNEVRYNEENLNTHSVAWNSEGAIMSFYDRQYRLLHRVFLDRRYGAFLDDGRGLSYALKDGKILAFGNELTGIAQYGGVCFVIDPKTFTVDKTAPDKYITLRGNPTMPETLFWFRHNWLETRSTEHVLLKYHFGCYLAAVPYQ